MYSANVLHHPMFDKDFEMSSKSRKVISDRKTVLQAPQNPIARRRYQRHGSGVSGGNPTQYILTDLILFLQRSVQRFSIVPVDLYGLWLLSITIKHVLRVIAACSFALLRIQKH